MELPKNVLIVEDEMLAQRYLKNILLSYNIRKITSASSAKESQKYIDVTSYDMVFMDINLRGSMDGIQLTKYILERQDVPIIFVTAYSDSETLSEVLKLSPYGYVIKPFAADDIKVAILVAYQRFNVLRKKNNPVHKKVIVFTDDLVYSLENECLIQNGKIISLSHKHDLFLRLLCENINTIVSSVDLVLYIWKGEETSGSLLRTLVYNMRKKLPELRIVSHSKIGYSLHEVKEI